MNNKQAKISDLLRNIRGASIQDVERRMYSDKSRITRYRWAVYLLSCAALILAVGWFMEAIV